MADKKISQLTALAAANLAPSTDVLAIVDTSATETKKIVAQDLINGVLNVASAVGIGTASPVYKLDVQSTGATTVCRFRTGSTGSSTIVDFGRSDQAVNAAIAYDGTGFIRFGTTTAHNLTLMTGAVDRVTVDTSGNLGLGVTPSGQNRLHVRYSSSGATPFSTSPLVIERSDVNLINMLSADGTDQGILFGDASDNDVGGLFYLHGSNSMTFRTNTSTAMTLDASGNLALGTTSAAGLFHMAKGGGYAWQYMDSYGAGYYGVLDSRCSRNSTVGSFTATNSGDNLFLIRANGTNSGATAFAQGATITFQQSAAAGATYVPAIIAFGTSDGTNAVTERARITSGGYFKASDDGTYGNATGTFHEFRNSANTVNLFVGSTNASFTAQVINPRTTKAAANDFSFIYCESNNAGDVEFNLRGDGNGYADGTWNNNGADYAEYFESATGGALTVGATVVLDGNKVREATAADPVSAIMGVVRPKEPGKASMVVGNTAWNKWANKYLTDDFDRYIMEDHDVVEWTDEDGKQHSYESHNIPDGVTVPADAVRKTHNEKGNKFQHYKLNPAWDKDAEYTPREKRDEWIIVGLVGQVKVLKGKPVNDRWIKMRDVSAAVEEWMIR